MAQFHASRRDARCRGVTIVMRFVTASRLPTGVLSCAQLLLRPTLDSPIIIIDRSPMIGLARVSDSHLSELAHHRAMTTYTDERVRNYRESRNGLLPSLLHRTHIYIFQLLITPDCKYLYPTMKDTLYLDMQGMETNIRLQCVGKERAEIYLVSRPA